jgi:hypothetical protein
MKNALKILVGKSEGKNQVGGMMSLKSKLNK